MSFSKELYAANGKISARGKEIFQGVYIRLFSAVILDTPVDTGRARGNWQISTTAPATGEVYNNDRSGRSAIALVNSFKIKNNRVVYLTNNLPYINRLEFDGHSKQAPAGMVRKNVTRFEKLLRRAAKAKR